MIRWVIPVRLFHSQLFAGLNGAHGVPGTPNYVRCPRNPGAHGVPVSPIPIPWELCMVSPESPESIHGNYVWCPRNPELYMASPESGVPGIRRVPRISESENYVWCPRNPLFVLTPLFVRSQCSQGMERGFIDPFVRSFAGARRWSGRGWRARNWLRPPLQSPCQARRKLHG
jgi:hypothetical protein